MQTLRFNPFGQVHKGLRALLYDTALLLQHTHFSKEEEVAEALERVRLVLSLFEHHAHIEDNQLFPMIEAYEPEIVTDFEAQHEEDHKLSQDLADCMARFNESNTDSQNQWAGNELLLRFNAFLAFNVEHMGKEETIINKCLWQYYTDEELLKKVQAISASIPPEQNWHFIFWMLKGMATHEIISWYNMVRSTAPPPVFNFFCELAGKALPEDQWNEIKEVLEEGCVLA